MIYAEWSCADIVLNGALNKNMKTADKGSQTIWNSPAIDGGKWRCKRMPQFPFRLTKAACYGVCTGYAQPVWLNAVMDYATGQTSVAVAAQTRHADLPAYAERLAASCSSWLQVVLMASPAPLHGSSRPGSAPPGEYEPSSRDDRTLEHQYGKGHGKGLEDGCLSAGAGLACCSGAQRSICAALALPDDPEELVQDWSLRDL